MKRFADGTEIVHLCPPVGGNGTCPCCKRTPFELPLDDRMALDPALVTCRPMYSKEWDPKWDLERVDL